MRELFVLVNRLLAPTHLRDAFEQYIARALEDEIGRVTSYYAERHEGFGSRSMTTACSGCSAPNGPMRTRWNCVACISIRPPVDAEPRGGC